jgi:ComF family protein
MPFHIDSVLNYFFSPSCLLCQNEGSFLCFSCQEKLSSLPRQICPVCVQANLSGQTHENCQGRYSLAGLVSVFAYRPYFKKIMAQIKFAPYLFAALKPITKLAVSYLDGEDRFLPFRQFLTQENPVVIPIPLYQEKYRQRGFNQAQTIGQILADHYNLALERKLLLRTRKTESQFNLDSKSRHENIKNAFAIDQERLANCSGNLPAVLLVDDIWTTGATMKEATRVLKKSGFAKVWGLTLAQ